MWLPWGKSPHGEASATTAASSPSIPRSNSYSSLTSSPSPVPRSSSHSSFSFSPSPIHRSNSYTFTSSPIPRSSSFTFSSFKDIEALFEDDDEDDGETIASPFYAARPPVLHRVRTASASSLRSWRSFPAPRDTRIVLYFTSLRAVRKTFEDCRAVRSILRGMRVAVDERDVSMDSGYITELKGLKQDGKGLPRVFIGGKCVGGADEVRQLHESGELRPLLEGVAHAPAGACERCGGARLVVCAACSGSHRLFSEKSGGFRSCRECNENGLVRCPDCHAPTF